MNATSDDERLAHLESVEDEQAESRRLDRRFELFEAVLLSIAAVLTAWAGFQSTKWSGEQADEYSRAGASRVESTKASTLAGQQSIVDVVSFTEWLAAAEREGLLDDGADPVSAYVPDPDTLSGFLYLRFRPEFSTAVETWLAAEPGLNAGAPATPFVMPEYQSAAKATALELEQQAEDHTNAARAANERSDQYVLMTILFATVLFFAGISSKMDTFRARTFLLSTATVLLVASTAIVFSFPMDF